MEADRSTHLTNRILVYGAGPLGSLFAARLKEGGNDVSILARGQRLSDLREHGIVLHDVTTDQRTVTRVDAVGKRCDVVLTLAALLCELPAGDLRGITRRWGASNRTRDSLVWMSEHLQDWKMLAGASQAELKRRLARRDYHRLERLWELEEKAATGRTACLQAIRRRARRVPRRRISPRPFVTGEDLRQAGLEEGPRLGRILSAVYEAQLNEEVHDRRSAMRLARRLMGKQGQ